jgi:subtilase family serine protease
LLAAQQNPTSTSFHQWLTPEQYGDRFGVAQSDVDKVSAWLQSKGFDVVETPASRNQIVFSGTAGQVEAAFHSEIHQYASAGQKFYANATDVSLPIAFAGIVAGVRGLNNFRMKPRALRNKESNSLVQPNFTSSISGSNYISPGDFATIYDLNPLYSAGTAINGANQSIVIAGQSDIVLADIANFRTASGLAANVPQKVLVTTTNPGVIVGDVQESSLDVEWAGAVARNANIIFVYSNNGAFDSVAYAISHNLAPVISISYGGCEPMFSASDVNSLVLMAQQANAQGITIVAASGDGGATDCDGDLSNYPAVLGLNLDVPASIPYVTAVGGTEFNEGNGTYWQPRSGTDIVSSALLYIPEMAWNDSSPTNGLAAGGGGASSLFGKPSWQTGSPADSARDIPDISLPASSVHDPYLVCTQIQVTVGGPLVSGCQNGFRISATNTGLTAYGGTSFGAPTFAGILALINQKTNSAGQGNVNYILYPLAASSPTAFHDIAAGSNNNSPCLQGTQNCPNGGTIGFSTATGYDLATGLGSIDATNLVNAWPSGGSSAVNPVLTSVSPTFVASGAADFVLTATGSGFPTGAQILWNGSTAGVTMLPGGTSTSITATISHTLVAYGTTASITVSANTAKAGESAAKAFTVSGTPPANDNIANAIAVTSSTFTSTVDNSAATTETTDPTPICALTAPAPSTNPRTKTVWWTLTAASSGSVTLSTIGSVYDTTLSVWTGAPGSLTNVACNDDVSSGQYTQSLLAFSATAGTKYYIMIAPFGPPDSLADQAGGKTILNVSNGNPSFLSASPSSMSVAAGASASFTITNVGTVPYTITCSGLPTGAACPAVTDPANGTATLVITTTSRTSGVLPARPEKRIHIDLNPQTQFMLGMLLFTVFVLRGRGVLKMIPVGVFALFILLAAGCGGTGGGSTGGTTVNPNGTPAGTYTITVTGTSGASTQVTSVTLTVT